MVQHTTNLPFAIDASSASPLRIDSSDSVNTISSELLSLPLLSSSLLSLLQSSRTSTIKKQKYHHHHHQQQHHHNRNNRFLFCGPNENGGFIAATPKKLQTEIHSNPINCSPGRPIIEFNFSNESNNGDGIPERLLVPVI